MPEFVSIPAFCSAVIDKKPLLFLGAGVSYAPPSALPLAKDLKNTFFEALISEPQMEAIVNELPDNPLDTLSSPELVYNATSEYATALVPQIFQAALDCDQPNINHWIAAQMVKRGLVERIITTNFDRLLEVCFGSKNISLRLEDESSEVEFNVWKIHGDFKSRMAIAMNDVSMLGFSAIPALLAKIMSRKCIVVMGYSGNDFHILRAIVDSRPEMVWWIVRSDDIPKAARVVSELLPRVVFVKGDLTRIDGDNPLVALWKKVGHETIPLNLHPANSYNSQEALKGKLSKVLSGMTGAQKGFVLNSLIRRAGTEVPHEYWVRLTELLHANFIKDNFFPDYLAPKSSWEDVAKNYERVFITRVAARPAVFKSRGISLAESDHFGSPVYEKSSIGEHFNRRDEAEILLEAGLESLFCGNFRRGRTILEVALKCAEGINQRALQMRSAEGLAWACLWLGDFQSSDEYHTVYSREIADLIEEIHVLRDSSDPLACGNLFQGFEPPDEPKELYSLLVMDHRFRPAVRALQLAGRLRYMGKAELGINVLEEVNLKPDGESIYTHVLRGFLKFEKARCLFFLGKTGEGLELMKNAEKDLIKIQDWDYEVLREFYKMQQGYYVKIGNLADAVMAYYYTISISY